MIYKEVTLAAAMQMVVANDLKNLFFENANGLNKVTESRFYLEHLKNYKWFKRIPEASELQKE